MVLLNTLQDRLKPHDLNKNIKPIVHDLMTSSQGTIAALLHALFSPTIATPSHDNEPMCAAHLLTTENTPQNH